MLVLTRVLIRPYCKQMKHMCRYISRGAGTDCQTSVDAWVTWPTCQIHYELVTSNDDYNSWAWDSLASPHGAIHFWLGGFIDCDTMYNSIGDVVGAEIASALSFLANSHRKKLFDEKVWSCKGTASVDETPTEVRKTTV